MTCRDFEAARVQHGGSQQLGSPDGWRALTEQLTQCGDCFTSLFQFLQVRQFIDHHVQPCLHVAYYSAHVPERCLDRDHDGHSNHGLYSIITEREKRQGVVIGFCPWCGVSLPVGA